VEEDVHEVGQQGHADRDEEDVDDHETFLRRRAGRRAAVDTALTALDAFLTARH
jgi:hypothetical protein